MRSEAKKPRPLALHASKEQYGKHTIGFTGTATPLTDDDKLQILAVLLGVITKYGTISTIYVTGGAVGVDAFITHTLHAAGCWVHVVLPPDHDKVDPDWHDWCGSYWQVKSDAPTRSARYMARNDILVASSDKMGAAFPREPETKRSGTWATIRRFRNVGKCDERAIFVLG